MGRSLCPLAHLPLYPREKACVSHRGVLASAVLGGFLRKDGDAQDDLEIPICKAEVAKQRGESNKAQEVMSGDACEKMRALLRHLFKVADLLSRNFTTPAIGQFSR